MDLAEHGGKEAQEVQAGSRLNLLVDQSLGQEPPPGVWKSVK
jgi:hypothetical protein